MYSLRTLFQKALQRYCFLRTQQNKMHKNKSFVHKLRFLCNSVTLLPS